MVWLNEHKVNQTTMKKQTIGILAGSIAISVMALARNEVPEYKVDGAFGQPAFQATPLSIAVTSKDQIHVLLGNGSVMTCDLAGKASGGFDSMMKPVPSVIVEKDGKIYLLATEMKEEEVVYQGKKRIKNQPAGVKCAVFSPDGAKESEFALPELLSARDAHFIGGKLAVGDLGKRQINFFEINNGTAKMVSEIKGEFRLCCGIFDFCPTSDGNSIFVANLGAFKVQEFSEGRKTSEFGARGSKLEEFHGCCNPVNVAALGSDFIVTVEKSPTRVKICDNKGREARIVEGLGELVKGCSVIPVAVDRQGAIYLASATKRCLVKCVTQEPVGGLSSAGGAGGAANVARSGHTELSEPRTWRNAESGKTIVGTLIAFEGTESVEKNGNIRLLIGEKTFELPLERLSQSDQEFVANLRKSLTDTAGE
jgi:hypothetical protein